MTKYFFFPAVIFYSFVFLTLYSWWSLPPLFNISITLIVVVVGYAFRRSTIPFRDTEKEAGEIYLAPVHGIVQSVRLAPDNHEVRISIGLWDEKGLYLPTDGEVTYLKAFAGEKIARDARAEAFYRPSEEMAHTDLTITSRNNVQSLLRFIDCSFGKRPTIWLKSGDKGRGAACFGYYPLGGTLIIYLPKNSDILVFEKERIVPGQSVIAALKNIK